MKPSQKIFKLTAEENLPLLCTFELTQRCNLSCRHCYIDFKNNKKIIEKELKTGEIKNILRQLANAGVLYLVFTGGEPFLRSDLLELCDYAKKLKFDLRIFTNGNLLTENTVKKLSSLNVSGVEISLYGRKKTHEEITNKKGTFSSTISAIKLLKKYKIPVTVKSPMMKTNFKDLEWLRLTSRKLKVKLHIDPTIAPKNNGDKSILNYRMSEKQMKKFYISQRDSLPLILCNSNRSDDNLFCSAGHNLLSISSEGMVYPCLQLPLKLGDLRKTRFSRIWDSKNKALQKYRNINFSDLKKCYSCKLSLICQRCPGLAYQEDGNIFGPSSIACKIARVMLSSKKPKNA
ncbi:MAG: radical SAM protein [Endomicrobiales bacterium]|nr:radical SAM protein [Endomicrobiales bacterium]